ncbi:glycine--tRNA ligase, mitochondrial 1-like protein [Tanacetum coccineum]
MRANELYKFSDWTLKKVRDELHHRMRNFRLEYNKEMPRRKWTTIDKRRSELMVELIDKQMRERRIIRNLERLVGARELEMDYKLMTYKCLVTTSQSIFDNFTFLHYWNGNKFPCTCATIGEAHRNELKFLSLASSSTTLACLSCFHIEKYRDGLNSPQKHLLSRFSLALVEHFIDPEDKSHQKYSQVSNLEFLMYSKDEQMLEKFAKRICLSEAVSKTMNEKDCMEMKAALESKGEVEFKVSMLKKTVTIKKSMVSISKETQNVHHRTFKSAVIESSFVMERIIYCLFEHSFYLRPSKAGEEEIYVFRFNPLVAPIQCPIVSLFPDQKYVEIAKTIC